MKIDRLIGILSILLQREKLQPPGWQRNSRSPAVQ